MQYTVRHLTANGQSLDSTLDLGSTLDIYNTLDLHGIMYICSTMELCSTLDVCSTMDLCGTLNLGSAIYLECAHDLSSTLYQCCTLDIRGNLDPWIYLVPCTQKVRVGTLQIPLVYLHATRTLYNVLRLYTKIVCDYSSLYTPMLYTEIIFDSACRPPCTDVDDKVIENAREITIV